MLDALFPLIHTLIGDAWSANMYMVMDAVTPYAWLFFSLLAAGGNFVLVQLFLAVISDSFVANEQARKEKEALDMSRVKARKALEKAAVKEEEVEKTASPAKEEGDGVPLLQISRSQGRFGAARRC